MNSEALEVQNDPVFLANLVEEMGRAPPMQMEIDAVIALQLVSLIQVALRCPDIEPQYARTVYFGEAFVRDIQHQYREYPTLHRLIELGFTVDAPPPPC